MGSKNSKKPPPDLGPDLLGRYLDVYMQSRQLSDLERPWGLGDDQLDLVWGKLRTAHNTGDLYTVNVLLTSLDIDVQFHILDTLIPLIFAIPIRTYPAELRVKNSFPHLTFTLSHDGQVQPVGWLPGALSGQFYAFMHRAMRISTKKRSEMIISSGGRRRRVHVTASDRGSVIRFLERVPSPIDDM